MPDGPFLRPHPGIVLSTVSESLAVAILCCYL